MDFLNIETDLFLADVNNYFIHLQQLRRTEKRWVRPSEVAKDGNEEEQKTEVCSIHLKCYFVYD